jgi:hypothetical protein
MGPHLMTHPPKFVHGFIDQHGKPRFYLRRKGFKKNPLPGLPWSPEFMVAYEAALAQQPLQVGVSRVSPGTVPRPGMFLFPGIFLSLAKTPFAVRLSFRD